MIGKLLRLGLLGGLIAWVGLLSGQVLLHDLEVEKFENDQEDFYPYSTWARAPLEPLLDFEPTLKLTDGSFVQLWKPDKFTSRKRNLSHYNLLLEEAWTLELEITRNESILGMMQHGDTLSIITHEYEFLPRNHTLRARQVLLEAGEELDTRLIQIISGRSADQLFYSFSPNRKRVAFYTFEHRNPLRRVNTEYTHIDRRQRLGYRVYHADQAIVHIYDEGLKERSRGVMNLPTRKHLLLGEDLDNEGNLYLYYYERKNIVKVIFRNAENGDVKTLTYDEDVPDLFDLENEYASHVPPSLGQGKKVLWGFADRVKRGKKRGIHSFRIVVFDFEKLTVNDEREAPVNSTLRVAVEKQRDAYHLPPLRRFDEYKIQEIVELPSGVMWLLTQKYEFVRADAQNAGYGSRGRIEDRIEELVMFQFDAEGQIQQAAIAPSTQLVRSFYDRLGGFYSMQVDTTEEVMHIVTREGSGKKMKDPDRLFYRYLDLETGYVSPRVQIYDAETRHQHWIRGYTTWLAPGIFSTVVMERSPGPVHLISVNLAAPAEEAADPPR